MAVVSVSSGESILPVAELEQIPKIAAVKFAQVGKTDLLFDLYLPADVERPPLWPGFSFESCAAGQAGRTARRRDNRGCGRQDEGNERERIHDVRRMVNLFRRPSSCLATETLTR